MSRKEQFGVGALLIASGLTVIVKNDVIAWFVLILGVGLIADVYLRDLIWGTDRLTTQQIAEMPADEYKLRVLENRKTERWVNFVSSWGTIKRQMRRLFRELVIFTLLALVAVVGGRFIFLYRQAHPPSPRTVTFDQPPAAQSSPRTVPIPPGATIGQSSESAPNQTPDFIPGQSQLPKGVTLDPNSFQPLACQAGDKYVDQGQVIWTCQNGVRSDFVAPSLLDLSSAALWFGLYGFFIGPGFWILYRASRFAIKG